MSQSNWPHVLLFDLTNKQCNGILIRWLHCLMLESKGRFLVNNNILTINVWLSVMSGYGTKPIFFNKKKIGHPEHLLTPQLLGPITSHFCLNPTPCSTWTSYVYHPLFRKAYTVYVLVYTRERKRLKYFSHHLYFSHMKLADIC